MSKVKVTFVFIDKTDRQNSMEPEQAQKIVKQLTDGEEWLTWESSGRRAPTYHNSTTVDEFKSENMVRAGEVRSITVTETKSVPRY
jgi:hypothetical protein